MSRSEYRRHLGQLAVLVAIPLRCPHVARALDDEELQRPRLEAIAVQDAARDDQVVAVLERQLAKRRLEHAAALADEHDLVSLRVAIEELVGTRRLDERHRDVGVEEERNAIQRQASAGAELMRPEVAMPELPLGIALPREVAHLPYCLHRRRLVQVIQQRRRTGKPLVADQLFGQQRAFTAEHRMALVRHGSKGVVNGHGDSRSAEWRVESGECRVGLSGEC